MKQASLIPEATERDPLDFNRTPAWCVELLIPHLGHPRTVLDVGCGDGAIGKVLRQAWPYSYIYGVEVHRGRGDDASMLVTPDEYQRRTYNGIWICDWLAWPADGPEKPDLIISNPPFGLPALRFLERAIERIAPGGTVAFLLPTHWDHDPDVESNFARQRFLDSIRLPDGREGYCKLAIVGGGPYPARPSFKKGGTASDRYAWFMFGEEWAGRPSCRLHAIPPLSPSPQLELIGRPHRCQICAKPLACEEDCYCYQDKPPHEHIYGAPPVPGATWNPRLLEWEAP